MQAAQQIQIPQREYLELYRLYMAYKDKAEELCRKYSIESSVVIFVH